MTRAPLRFLLCLLALWIGARAAILLPDWPDETRPIPAAVAATQPARARATPDLAAATAPLVDSPRPGPGAPPPHFVLLRATPPQSLPARTIGQAGGSASAAPVPPPSIGPEVAPPPLLIALPAPTAPASVSRWSVTAWLLVRDDAGAPSLAPGGTLGGSQAGARLSYALGGGLSLSARAYLPLRQSSGAEVAAGIDWRLVRSLPVNLLAERRQRLSRDGRNAFALTLYGGASRNLTQGTRLDIYGQAGVVGLRSRDLFADGALRLSRRVGPIEFGAGAWGAAQPGAARLDAGPSLSWRLPLTGADLRLHADWRFRIAGDAAPRSGPALTLAADF